MYFHMDAGARFSVKLESEFGFEFEFEFELEVESELELVLGGRSSDILTQLLGFELEA